LVTSLPRATKNQVTKKRWKADKTSKKFHEKYRFRIFRIRENMWQTCYRFWKNANMMLLSPIWRHKLIMRKDSVTVIDSWVGTNVFLKTNKFLFKPLIWFDNFAKLWKSPPKFQKNTKNQQKECNMMVFPPFSQPLNLASYNYHKKIKKFLSDNV
jgi:hypothetical protein